MTLNNITAVDSCCFPASALTWMNNGSPLEGSKALQTQDRCKVDSERKICLMKPSQHSEAVDVTGVGQRSWRWKRRKSCEEISTVGREEGRGRGRGREGWVKSLWMFVWGAKHKQVRTKVLQKRLMMRSLSIELLLFTCYLLLFIWSGCFSSLKNKDLDFRP